MESSELGLRSSALENDELIVEVIDAVIGLYSNEGGTWGSALALAEVTAAGSIPSKWGIARHTGATGGLFFTFGTSDKYANIDAQMVIQSDGDVHAYGTFTGGGADFAEYFPLVPGAAVATTEVVGLRNGLASLETNGADLVASSDPTVVAQQQDTIGALLRRLEAVERLASQSTASR